MPILVSLAFFCNWFRNSGSLLEYKNDPIPEGICLLPDPRLSALLLFPAEYRLAAVFFPQESSFSANQKYVFQQGPFLVCKQATAHTKKNYPEGLKDVLFFFMVIIIIIIIDSCLEKSVITDPKQSMRQYNVKVFNL